MPVGIFCTGSPPLKRQREWGRQFQVVGVFCVSNSRIRQQGMEGFSDNVVSALDQVLLDVTEGNAFCSMQTNEKGMSGIVS